MSAPKDVVWRETDAPFQWIGMHIHHGGGIRCNSRAFAEKFMRSLCGDLGCNWVKAYDPPRATKAARGALTPTTTAVPERAASTEGSDT